MIKENKNGQKKPQNIHKRSAAKAKKKKNREGSGVVLICVVVLTALLIILGALVFSADRVIDDEKLSSENSELLSTVSSDEMGFPVTFSNNDIIRVESFSSKIFVLGKKILTCVSDSGKVKFNRIFTFTKPEMTVSDNYGLVYDRASSKYFIFNGKGVIYEGESENKKHIITARINNNGDVAFVTKSDDGACRVYLVDKKGEELYIWACAEEYGVSIDLSDDGREILCGAIGSENGEIYSVLYRLETYSDENAAEYRLDGSALVDVRLVGKKAVVTTDKSRSVYTFRGSSAKDEHTDIPETATAFYSDKNGNTVIVSDKVGTISRKEIRVYNKNNDIIYVGFTDEEVVDVICRGKKVYLLTDKAIYESESDGSFSAVGTKEISGEGLVICKSRLYYYSTGHIDINS